MAADSHRGSDGPLTTRWSRYPDPVSEAFAAAGLAAGHPATDDYNGAQQEGFEFGPIARQWTEQLHVARTISPEASCCLLNRTFEDHSRTVIKRMREGSIGLNEGESVPRERKRAKKRRRKRERHHRSANILDKSG